MTWVRIDDQMPDHPKVLAAGAEPMWLYVCGLCYCGRQLTDGHIPAAMVRRLADVRHPEKAAEKLVEVGLWEPTGNGYQVVNYLDFQPSKKQVESRRAVDSRRRALHSDPGLTSAVRERDGSACRYCGEAVNWKDRRSDKGATYDHVDPTGPNELENVVVACRGCNARKSNRTPDQAGMRLRSIPTKDLDPNQNGSSHPSRPIPSPSADQVHLDDDRLSEARSSSSEHPHWDLIAEAGQVAARLRTPAPRDPDAFATGAARNILREHGDRIESLIDARPDLDFAGLAFVLATEGAGPSIERARPVDVSEPDWVPADRIEVRS